MREDGEVWSTAVSQIFFSLSVTFGIMTAYGSYCPRGEPAVINSTVVAICNSLFSFISGFAVFASLGHLAHLSGVKVTDLEYGGFSLGTLDVIAVYNVADQTNTHSLSSWNSLRYMASCLEYIAWRHPLVSRYLSLRWIAL